MVFLDYLKISENVQVVQNSFAMLKEEIKSCTLLAKNDNHHFYPLYENMLLIEAIRKHVEEKEIDYILMGTKGASKSNRNNIGSNTSEVITKVKCPILAIPENAKFNKIKNISFLTDYNSIYRNKVISKLSEALRLQQAALRVLNIRSQNLCLLYHKQTIKDFCIIFLRKQNTVFTFWKIKKLKLGIQAFVETWEIDMIAISAKNLNLIERLLFRSIKEPISYQSEVPFLVLHE